MKVPAILFSTVRLSDLGEGILNWGKPPHALFLYLFQGIRQTHVFKVLTPGSFVSWVGVQKM